MVTDTTEAGAQLKEAAQPISPGLRLRKLREARRLSVTEMAKCLCLSQERLTQLENDDYHLMSAPAFAKGYLRAYANQLGVDKGEILAILTTFDELNLGAEIPHNVPELLHEKMELSSQKSLRWVSYLMLILLVGLLGYLGYGRLNNLNKPVTSYKPAATADTSEPLPDAASVQNSMAPTTTLDLPTLPAPPTSVADPIPLKMSPSLFQNKPTALTKTKTTQLEE